MFARYAIYMLLLLTIVGCKDVDSKAESTGRNYEVYVVTPGERWRGPLGDTLRHFMADEVEFINQLEPRLSLYYIEPSAYNTLISRHRNLMLIEINEKYQEPAITATYDYNSTPQILVSLVAPDEQSLIDYVAENGEYITRAFEIAEKDRYVKYAQKYGNENIEKVVKEMFGIEMNIPVTYKIRNQMDDFLWTSFENRLVSQGIIFYSYPYTGKNDMSNESIVKRRNEFVKNIPGPSDGSFMSTTDVIPSETSYNTINDRLWAETMGFWHVDGDYMGGPFRSYTTVDTETNMVLCIDMYLFSPKYDKRNYIRELESLIYTVKVE